MVEFSEVEALQAGSYIREVILENFMSHEYSRVKLRPGMNVITGPNGAGKSSILLGISVALGQTYTERGERLSDLIQRGKDAARVTVILDNQSRGGMRIIKGVNSDTVAITRYIKKNGEYWHYVNNRFMTKAEVDNLLRGIGINPNNMLIIMHQNMIESFAAKNNAEKLQMVEDAVGMASLRERIIGAESRLNKLRSEEASLKKVLNEAEAAVEYWRGELAKLTKLRELERRKAELEAEYAWSLVENVRNSIERKKRTIEKLRQEREGLIEEANRLATLASQQRKDIERGLEDRLPPEDLLVLIDGLVSTSVRKGIAEYRADELGREIGEYERDLEELRSELEERLRNAEGKGAKVEVSRSPDVILEELRLTTLNIATLGRVVSDAESMYLLADSRFNEVKNRAEELRSNIEKALKEVERRKEVWRSKLKELVDSVEPIFVSILSSIGASGRIILRGLEDISTASLELHVGFRGAEPTILDAHTHSGGERIVATLAFLLALQSHIKSSFRAVDEFDVHLDPINREMVVRIMFETARRNPGTQYILITPGRIPIEGGVNVIVVQNVSSRSIVASSE